MAIEQTGAIYKTLTFDGESSGTYGVYITGEAVYNAPEREVEMISIPGRSGQLALDKGRFENIEVTYPAGIFADNEEDFAEGISNFRNFLCSRNGYVRLQDDYNPNEYRLAIYKSGLEVDNALHRAGEFDIVFDCKPQRYLTSGETAIEVDSGDVITNPTLFEASPLLEVEGYGDIGIGDKIVTINDVPLGTVDIFPNNHEQKTRPLSNNAIVMSEEYSTAPFNQGDTLTLSNMSIRLVEQAGSGNVWQAYTVGSSDFFNANVSGIGTSAVTIVLTPINDITSLVGTATSEITKTVALTNRKVGSSSSSATLFDASLTFTYGISVDGSTEEITESCYVSSAYSTNGTVTLFRGSMSGFSTVSLLGHPTYIDCDMGEAYKEESGEYISLNTQIDLGSDLPTLASGANTITFDNTITDLKVTPRWWKI